MHHSGGLAPRERGFVSSWLFETRMAKLFKWTKAQLAPAICFVLGLEWWARFPLCPPSYGAS